MGFGVKFWSKAELENLPSLEDGLTKEEEERYRRGVCALIQDAGMQLRFPQWTIGTAWVLCHRFFAMRSLRRNDRFLIAIACLFLAGKIKESPRPLHKIIEVAYTLRAKTDVKQLEKMKDQAFMDQIHEHVVRAERVLLCTLGFDFDVQLSYQRSLDILKRLNLMERKEEGDQSMSQLTVNFLNDCLRTTMCLQYTAESIAAAAVSLAAYVRNVEVDHSEIWKYAQKELSEEILGKMYSLYEAALMAQQVWPK